MANFDDMKLAVESLSGGKNTVILDDVGMPSVMVEWPKVTNKALFGGSEIVHPGNIINGVEKTMYVSKYLNIVYNNRAYSLPGQDPRASLNFDQAVQFCRNKGNGWGLTPYSLWAEIALWCRKNGTMPRGNNNYGSDHAYPHETGRGTYFNADGRVQRTATGSGPATWNHNWMPDGIADLNGNVYEWCAGMRLVNGEIQVIPYANSMLPEVSLGADSTSWKAISAAGELVAPGTAGTLKYDWVSGKIQLTSGDVTNPTAGGQGCTYQTMTLKSGLTAPELAKSLILYPDEPNGDYGGDYHYMNPEGERLPVCGGRWGLTGSAGVFCVSLSSPRSNSYVDIGFRSAYCSL